LRSALAALMPDSEVLKPMIVFSEGSSSGLLA